jgi:4-hydroxy 2-oxovalerate aldolase
MDVTLRDGGYVNGFSFSVKESTGVARLLDEAGIPFLEIGYFIPGRTTPDDLGRKGYTIEHMREVAASCRSQAQPVVMIPPGVASANDYLELARAGVKVVRFPVSPPRIDQLPPEVNAARKAGLRISLNLVRVSEYSMEELLAVGDRLAAFDPDWIYLADSNGGLFPDQVQQMVRALKNRIRVPLGFHPHNGLSLAFVNSLVAISEGISMLDASLGGIGKGGGNLGLEAITLYLNSRGEAAFRFPPVMKASRDYLMPWLGEGWPKRLKENLSSIINLNQQTLITMNQQAGGNTWELVEKLVLRFEEKYCKVAIGA